MHASSENQYGMPKGRMLKAETNVLRISGQFPKFYHHARLHHVLQLSAYDRPVSRGARHSEFVIVNIIWNPRGVPFDAAYHKFHQCPLRALACQPPFINHYEAIQGGQQI